MQDALAAPTGRSAHLEVPDGGNSAYRGTAGSDRTDVQAGEGASFNYRTSPGQDQVDFHGKGQLNVVASPTDNIVASDANGPFFRQGNPEGANITKIQLADGGQLNVQQRKEGAQASSTPAAPEAPAQQRPEAGAPAEPTPATEPGKPATRTSRLSSLRESTSGIETQVSTMNRKVEHWSISETRTDV